MATIISENSPKIFSLKIKKSVTEEYKLAESEINKSVSVCDLCLQRMAPCVITIKNRSQTSYLQNTDLSTIISESITHVAFLLISLPKSFSIQKMDLFQEDLLSA